MEENTDRPAKRQKVSGSDQPLPTVYTPEPEIKDFLDLSNINLYGKLASGLGSECATEAIVGIEEFVVPLATEGASVGFEGILKHRFTDFLVYEIDLSGNMVQLAAPPKIEDQPKKEPAQQKQQNPAVWSWTAENEELVVKCIGSDRINDFKEFWGDGKKPNGKDSRPSLWESSVVNDKAARSLFHQTFRQVFENRLLTSAHTRDTGDQIVKVSWSTSTSSKADKKRLRSSENEAILPFIHFAFQKTNLESQAALGTIGRMLGKQSKDLMVAGTKDKRGITRQGVSIKSGKLQLQEVWRKLNNKRGLGGIEVGYPEYKDYPLRLGSLKGNHFVITIRNVTLPSEENTTITPEVVDLLSKTVSTFPKMGFINYYGMQRFGTSPIPTHLVGLTLLLSQYSLAVSLIIHSRTGESDDSKEARQLFKAGEWEEAAQKMPRRCVAEKCVMDYLVAQKREGREPSKMDWLGALSKIPKNLRMMYVHAYQSYVFNRAASERIRLFGSNPVVGDLVYINEPASEIKMETNEEELLDADLEKDEKADNSLIRALTESDVAEGKYTIHDVLLPLPGFAITYPSGPVGELYKQILCSDGLDPDNMFRRQKEYSMGGTYRYLLHKPKDVNWRWIKSGDPSKDLIDESIIRTGSVPIQPEADLCLTEGLALQIEFTLGAGTFATMALRELMKTRTEQKEQKERTGKMEARWTDAQK